MLGVMATVPDAWLWVSGIFFALGIIVLFAILIGCFLLFRMVADLMDRVKAISANVEQISDRAKLIAERVEETSLELKASTSQIARRTTSLADTAAPFLERFGPAVIVVMSIIRLFRMFRK